MRNRTAASWAVLLYGPLSFAAWLVLLPLVEDNNAAVKVGATIALHAVGSWLKKKYGTT